ncbi:hypothetical protein TNCV_3073621 [Trichonephila clavipes]|nr:hypothetical protein TNCV_3073621 [Trichonephila clavipes]
MSVQQKRTFFCGLILQANCNETNFDEFSYCKINSIQELFEVTTQWISNEQQKHPVRFSRPGLEMWKEGKNGPVNGNCRGVLRMYHAQFPDRRMPDHRIFQWLHLQQLEHVRSTSPDMILVDKELYTVQA